MNYMRELNAFRDWAMITVLLPIALWHMLMSVNNMTGWKTWFTAPNQTFSITYRIVPTRVESTRNSLIQFGLIEYKKGDQTRQEAIE